MLHLSTRREWEESDTLYQLTDPHVLADPYPFCTQLQELGPLYFDYSVGAYVCTRYAEGRSILQQSHNFGASLLHAPDPTISAILRQQMLVQDGDAPWHKHLRTVMQPHFRPAFYQQLRSEVHDMAHAVLNRLKHNRSSSIDLVGDYAAEFPTRISAALLGLPVNDVPTYMRWNEAYEKLLGLPLPEHELQRDVLPALHEAVDVLTASVDARRRLLMAHPPTRPENIIDALLLSPYAGQVMETKDLVAQIIVLLAGGYKTGSHLITMTLYWLQEVGQTPLVKQDRTLIASAVRECMSYDGSSLFLARKAKHEVTLAGSVIPAGETVFVLLPAANRDQRSREGVSEFDCRHAAQKHVGFGAGGHLCPGGPLAEFYSTIALDALLDVFPDVTIDAASLRWGSLTSVRCPAYMLATLYPTGTEVLPLDEMKERVQ